MVGFGREFNLGVELSVGVGFNVGFDCDLCVAFWWGFELNAGYGSGVEY